MSAPAKPETKTVTVSEGGKAKADFFAAVRNRGMMNAMLEVPAKEYEAMHPGMKTRWEFCPPNGDNSMVVSREAIGYKIVDASELSKTPSSQASGPVRRGDLILMACPEALHNVLADADARAAQEDLRLPETTYRQALEETKVRVSSGEEDHARPIGQVVRTQETIAVPVTNDNA